MAEEKLPSRLRVSCEAASYTVMGTSLRLRRGVPVEVNDPRLIRLCLNDGGLSCTALDDKPKRTKAREEPSGDPPAEDPPAEKKKTGTTGSKKK